MVVYRRKPELSASRQTISSRQSPSRSAVNVGVALLPLFDAHWAQLSSVPPPYLVIEVPSSSSREVQVYAVSRRVGPSEQRVVPVRDQDLGPMTRLAQRLEDLGVEQAGLEHQDPPRVGASMFGRDRRDASSLSLSSIRTTSSVRGP